MTTVTSATGSGTGRDTEEGGVCGLEADVETGGGGTTTGTLRVDSAFWIAGATVDSGRCAARPGAGAGVSGRVSAMPFRAPASTGCVWRWLTGGRVATSGALVGGVESMRDTAGWVTESVTEVTAGGVVDEASGTVPDPVIMREARKPAPTRAIPTAPSTNGFRARTAAFVRRVIFGIGLRGVVVWTTSR